VREADEFQPHAVVFEVAEGHVAHAGVFVVADLVLDVDARAVVAAGNISSVPPMSVES
jgi:hypothetical protein